MGSIPPNNVISMLQLALLIPYQLRFTLCRSCKLASFATALLMGHTVTGLHYPAGCCRLGHCALSDVKPLVWHPGWAILNSTLLV